MQVNLEAAQRFGEMILRVKRERAKFLIMTFLQSNGCYVVWMQIQNQEWLESWLEWLQWNRFNSEFLHVKGFFY